MIAHVILGVFSVVWGALGLACVIAPAPLLARMERLLLDPWQRFWSAQAVLLIGLLLIIGTSSLEGRWVWAVCGAIGVGKACFVLGASEALRERVWRRVCRWPAWLYRGAGALDAVLAVLLAADLLLYG